MVQGITIISWQAGFQPVHTAGEEEDQGKFFFFGVCMHEGVWVGT
jgi:hypothetical protein